MTLAEKDAKTVLVLEDDTAIQGVLLELLSQEGYRVLQAADGVSGVELAHQHAPDAILLDLNLPPTSGLDVLGTLKGGQATSQIPVVGVSGDPSPAASDGPELDAFIQKPFDIDSLLEHIGRAVERSGAPPARVSEAAAS